MKKPVFRVYPYASSKYHFVVRAKVGGKWQRKYFATKGEAETYADQKSTELLNKGREAVEFPSWLRVMAEHCQGVLKPFGKTIRDATEHFVQTLKDSEKSCTVGDLVKELREAKKSDGASLRYLEDLKSRLTRFSVDFDGKIVATITAAQIDDWLRGLKVSPVTRNNFRRILIVMFNFAVQRGYATINAAEKTAKAKIVDAHIQILTPAQTSRLLKAANSETLPYFGIGCFAGLRPAELARLDWAAIDFTSGLIEVSAKNSKTARRRLVKILPNLDAWIRPLAKTAGPIAPPNLRKLLEKARTDAKLSDWPSNALRHSYASYHLAHFNDAAALALEMGHTNTAMIFQHYRQLVKPKEAAKYWKIVPKKSKKLLSPATR